MVLLFKAELFSGTLTSSEEGQMEWVAIDRLPGLKTVDDLGDLLRVMNSPDLSEFQYIVDGDEWTVSLK